MAGLAEIFLFKYSFILCQGDGDIELGDANCVRQELIEQFHTELDGSLPSLRQTVPILIYKIILKIWPLTIFFFSWNKVPWGIPEQDTLGTTHAKEEKQVEFYEISYALWMHQTITLFLLVGAWKNTK